MGGTHGRCSSAILRYQQEPREEVGSSFPFTTETWNRRLLCSLGILCWDTVGVFFKFIFLCQLMQGKKKNKK